MSFIVKLMAKCCGDWMHHKSGEKKYQCFFIFKVDTRLCVCRSFRFCFHLLFNRKRINTHRFFEFQKKILFFRKSYWQIRNYEYNIKCCRVTQNPRWKRHGNIDAAVAELADAHVWGACGQPYGFKSHQPHQEKKKSRNATFSFLYHRKRGENN